jgi:UDP-N-acetyl-D-mannosaminuronate dehydrogenase
MKWFKKKNEYVTNNLIIGLGEIGSAVKEINKDAGNIVSVIDVGQDIYDNFNDSDIDFIHICIPYSNKFIQIIVDYLNKYELGKAICIIHSTVPIGTTRKIQALTECRVFYSFCRGVHPNLKEGLLTFTKYFCDGGEAIAKWQDVAGANIIKYYNSLGIECQYLGHFENGEAAKIISTTYYGYNILFAKEVKKICNEHNLSFNNVYTYPNVSYNKGYIKLGKYNVVRPTLSAPNGKIGGHCVVPNFNLLPKCDLKNWCLKQNTKDY